MTQPAGGSEKPTHITTATGRILRIDTAALQAQAQEASTSGPSIPDPARRKDVLFRVRREQGHEISAWWMIGAFVVTSGLVILLLGWVPGGA